MKLKLLLLPALLTALTALTACGALAEDMTYVLVTFRNTPLGVINRANYRDFEALKNKSAVGLMNSRTAGKTCFQNVAATIASGTRTSIYPENSRPTPFEHYLNYPPATLSALADNPYYLNGCIAEEKDYLFGQALRDLYTRTKRRDIPPGALINPGAARLTKAEESVNPSAKPGLLADTLGDCRV
ncbi:MAG: hypothetical protein IJT95_01315, partial [Abditibacteriota bacterium]|nr:hypothetical protein [Abditibacteriota bacterium]